MARKADPKAAPAKGMPAKRSRRVRQLSALANPDEWALLHELKVDGHSFTIEGREYLVAPMRDESPRIDIPKGAQMGFTIAFIVRTFHWVTVRNWHHLYLMPLKTGAIPFVQGRIDPIIDTHPFLKEQFGRTDNRTHKQTVRAVNWYVRGTNIWTELREIPVDAQVWDERDKMVEENLPEAEARLDGSRVKRIVELSTPTVPGHGVDAADAWHSSDQHRWYVPCPHCSRFQTFSVDENVVIGDTAEECFLRCSHCKKKIDDATRQSLNQFGRWEPDVPGASRRGYRVSQLNSPTQTIPGFMKNYFDGQRDAKKMRAWYNNNRGEPFANTNEQFTPELLDKCIVPGLRTGGIPHGPVYIGVDVSPSRLHCKASYLDRHGRRVSWAFKIITGKDGDEMFKNLEQWLRTIPNFNCVIDAHPEKTRVAELSVKFPGRVWVGFEMDRPNQADTCVFDRGKMKEPSTVKIDRTMAFDSTIGTYINGEVLLPMDARELGEHMPKLQFNGFYHQMCQQARSEEEDTKGRLVAFWKKNRNPDHWHHADMFEWVASQRLPAMNIPTEVGELFQRAGGVIANA